jgi:formate-dependent nitrite reductase membrane component NrfD/NAD-dependent dihydropyrimidine dehydrogenase PreA subunit
MYQRQDGIVEFDPEICIGCKACMQACPYDAIYIDPETHSAAKCHFCSHRTDLGLEPACVIVCPTQSIIAGDLDDPDSQIRYMLTRHQVNVRKPEQGTAPKLFYIEGDDVALTPTAASANFMWAEMVSEQNIYIPLPEHPHNGQPNGGSSTKTAHSGAAIRTPAAQGVGYRGPIHLGGGRVAEQMVQTTYNAQHQLPWHWPVPAYLVTKGIGSGLFSLLAIFFGLDLAEFNPPLALLGNFCALLFIGLTTLLLVMDLDKPTKFYTILTRPQWKSWLTRGAFILIGFTLIAGLWLLIEGAAFLALIPTSLAAAARLPLLGLGLIAAVGSAIYTAFLFGQAEGRDLWQSTLLPAHLALQALMVGSGVLLGLGLFVEIPFHMIPTLIWIFAVALLVDLLVTLLGEFGMPHASEVAARAAHAIRHGSYRGYYWYGSIILGHIVPLVIVLVTALSGSISLLLVAIAALAAITGLYLFEYAFVMAPQEVPNS